MQREKSRNNDRRNMIWNAAAGMLNAAEAVFIMAIVSRTDGIETAGVFSLAFSLANLFMSIAKYGVKEFQVINGESHFSFGDYFYHRVILTAVMIAVECGYAGIGLIRGSMGARKAWIIALVCLWYTLEAYEDVYLGKHQLEGNLYIGSQQFILRWAAVLAVFCGCALMGVDTVAACGAALIAGCVVSVVNIVSTNRMYGLELCRCRQGKIERSEKTGKDDGEQVPASSTCVSRAHIAELTRRCFPLFVSYFAYFYVNNLPKYMINSYQTDEMQAIYGYLFMPVFAVPLVNSFLYQPKLLETSNCYKSGDKAGFRRCVIRQYAIIAGLAVCCAAGAWLLGIPVLSLLYHVDLSAYKSDLILLLMGGALLSAAGYTSVMVTVIGRQDKIIICYALAIIAELGVCPNLVKTLGVRGAAMGFTMTMFILAAAMTAALLIGMRSKDEDSDE